jgi:hypothetical protein
MAGESVGDHDSAGEGMKIDWILFPLSDKMWTNDKKLNMWGNWDSDTSRVS